MMTFLVVNGFSFWEIRKLYTDELAYFYKETIYTLEKTGKLKEGTYKAINTPQGQDVEVHNLRSQLKSILKHGK